MGAAQARTGREKMRISKKKTEIDFFFFFFFQAKNIFDNLSKMLFNSKKKKKTEIDFFFLIQEHLRQLVEDALEFKKKKSIQDHQVVGNRMVLKERHTCAMNRAKFPPVEISCISDSSAASGMPLSRGACCSLAGASLSITTAGFVSVNSTDSATDAAEKPEKEGEGAPRLRSSSPMICTGWMLDVLSAAWFLVAFVASLAMVAFERLCCSMLQSAQARSSSVNCSCFAHATTSNAIKRANEPAFLTRQTRRSSQPQLLGMCAYVQLFFA
jgi:hypothetical protein